MNVFDKVRWRVEKYALDPLVRKYLRNRFFEKNDLLTPTIFSIEPSLSALNYKFIFQCMATSQDMSFLWESDFCKAFEHGMQNDPINIKQK